MPAKTGKGIPAGKRRCARKQAEVFHPAGKGIPADTLGQPLPGRTATTNKTTQTNKHLYY